MRGWSKIAEGCKHRAKLDCFLGCLESLQSWTNKIWSSTLWGIRAAGAVRCVIPGVVVVLVCALGVGAVSLMCPPVMERTF